MDKFEAIKTIFTIVYDIKSLGFESWSEFSIDRLLKKPEVSKVLNYQHNMELYEIDNTPLHLLGLRGVTQILLHPEVAILKNLFGKTPLHYLASFGAVAVLNHPQVFRVVDKDNDTPLHEFLNYQTSTDFLSSQNTSPLVPKKVAGILRCPPIGLLPKRLRKLLKNKYKTETFLTEEMCDYLRDLPNSVLFIVGD